MILPGERKLRVLARFKGGRLELLSELCLPDGWIGHVTIADEWIPGDVIRKEALDLHSFQGGAAAVPELSEDHDQMLRKQSLQYVDERHA
jgi:hypothetical protein